MGTVDQRSNYIIYVLKLDKILSDVDIILININFPEGLWVMGSKLLDKSITLNERQNTFY